MVCFLFLFILESQFFIIATQIPFSDPPARARPAGRPVEPAAGARAPAVAPAQAADAGVRLRVGAGRREDEGQLHQIRRAVPILRVRGSRIWNIRFLWIEKEFFAGPNS